VSLRIGCDLDGVLADMESELIRHAKALFGDLPPRVVKEPPAQQTQSGASIPFTMSPVSTSGLGAMDMTERQLRRLWHHVASIDGFWETLKEIEPGTVAQLARLSTERRWELIFLTKRPESAGATTQVQTQRWLQAQGFTLPSVFVVQGSRGRVAAAFNLDFVVDDRPENCLDVVLDSTARALLLWREEEIPLPAAAKQPGVQVVTSMAQCLDLLERADRPARERPGLVSWVKKQLGYDDAKDGR
jgi:hypothetical protein